MSESCENCKYSNTVDNGWRCSTLKCRRNPPTPVHGTRTASSQEISSGAYGGEISYTFGVHPSVENDDWCGEYKAVEVVE
jgi:hypothetical protein